MNVRTRFVQALVLTAVVTAVLTLGGTMLVGGIGFTRGLAGLSSTATRTQLLPTVEQAVVDAVAMGSLFAAVGAVTLIWLLSRALAQIMDARLQRFVHFSRRVSRGDFTSRLAVRDSDELGELAYALNRMAEELGTVDRRQQRFMAAVAHDLRTPLTAIQANLEGMITGVIPSEPERLAALHSDAGRLIRLVEDLLTLASARAGALPLSRRVVDVVAQAKAIADRFQPLADTKGQHLVCELPDQGQASIDPDRVDEILTNLLSNAIRHVPKGGHIVMRLEVGPGAVRWTVADDGPGIPPDVLPTVKEPFVRGDTARGRQAGSGLGLAIADTWARAHGGTLGITGGHGTMATLTIPR